MGFGTFFSFELVVNACARRLGGWHSAGYSLCIADERKPLCQLGAAPQMGGLKVGLKGGPMSFSKEGCAGLGFRV